MPSPYPQDQPKEPDFVDPLVGNYEIEFLNGTVIYATIERVMRNSDAFVLYLEGKNNQIYNWSTIIRMGKAS